MNSVELFLPDEMATLAFAAKVRCLLPPGSLVFLHGNLGAGKTTFVRGFLRASGYAGAVKSPTFTLVEEYTLEGLSLFHFDLYRLNDPEELEWLGMRDYLNGAATCFIEWPERGAGLLPVADLEIRLQIEGTGRRAEVIAGTERGLNVVRKWAAKSLHL